MSSAVDNKRTENRKRAEYYIQYIAAQYGLTPERQEIIGIRRDEGDWEVESSALGEAVLTCWRDLARKIAH